MSHNFLPLPTTAPSFNASVTATGDVFRIETSSTTARQWGSPTNRYIRVTGAGGDDITMSFGTTAATDLPVIGSNMLLLMPETYFFPATPKFAGVSFISTAAATVNVTLGTMIL